MTTPAEPQTAADASGELDGMTFDTALAELERTVATLESGGQPLEETIALYERAVALERHCTRLLAEARLRMEQLVERAGGGLDATQMRVDEPSHSTDDERRSG